MIRPLQWVAAGLVVSTLVSCQSRDEPPANIARYHFEIPEYRGDSWFKGNTHAHTNESDGDSPPEVVARWYKDHGYDFLVLSDHNVRVDPDRFASVQDSSFLLIAGEELTTTYGDTPVHVNALDIPAEIVPRTDTTLIGTIQKNVDAVRSVDGVPHINHPNFRWAFGFEELIQVHGDRLLEIWSGHPLVHNNGALRSPGVELIWDQLLSSGKVVYGIAVDDAHHFQGEFAPNRVNPGRGWVAVRTDRLHPRSIVEALEAGSFYASTGVVITEIEVDSTRLSLQIEQESDFRYFTYFIGSDGQPFGGAEGTNPVAFLHSPTRYVRARIVDSGGRMAWTQPVFVNVIGEPPRQGNARFLALGDSYTIGESVPESDRWSHQLVERLNQEGVEVDYPTIIARTGWTTDELDEAISRADLEDSYELVTLLIGVNNQYRGRDAVEYFEEFDLLLDRAIGYARGVSQNVVVLSIPDWGATPAGDGQDRARITAEIDVFNDLAERSTSRRGARWVEVTDLTRRALDEPSLTAADGLHPSGELYGLWVERLLPVVREVLGPGR